MDTMLLWKIREQVTLFQAVMLALNYDPQNITHEMLQNSKKKPKEYEALLSALKFGLEKNSIEGFIVGEWDEDFQKHKNGTIDPDHTKVDLISVGKFLLSKGIQTPFLAQSMPSEQPEYLNPNHPFYASKLAAAIHAWLAVVADPKVLHKKSPKAAMQKWLRLNAKTYGLTLEDGSPNTLGIDEICKVANWKPKGGAPKSADDDLPPITQVQEQTHPPLKYMEENNNSDGETTL